MCALYRHQKFVSYSFVHELGYKSRLPTQKLMSSLLKKGVWILTFKFQILTISIQLARIRDQKSLMHIWYKRHEKNPIYFHDIIKGKQLFNTSSWRYGEKKKKIFRNNLISKISSWKVIFWFSAIQHSLCMHAPILCTCLKLICTVTMCLSFNIYKHHHIVA